MANESKFPNGIDTDGGAIVNVANPVNPQDVATKSYVESMVGGFNSIVIVNTLLDLPTVSGGKYTLLANTLYWVEATVLNIGTDYLEFSNGTTMRGNSSLSNTIVYSGTGGALRGTDVNSSISFIAISSPIAFDFSNTARNKNLSFQNIAIANQTSQSKIVGYDIFFTFVVNYINCVGGINLTNSQKAIFRYHNWDDSCSGTYATLNPNTYTEYNISACDIHVSTGVSNIGFNVTSTNISSAIIEGCTFEGSAPVSQRLVGVNGNTTNWIIQYGANVGISGLQFTDVDVISTADATFPNTAGTVVEGGTVRAYVPTLAFYDSLATNMQGKVIGEFTSVEATIQIGLRNLNTLTNLGGLQPAVLPATLGSVESDYIAITPNRLYTAYYVKTNNTGGNVATRFAIKVRIKTF